MCMAVWPLHVFVYHMPALYQWRPERIDSPQTGVTDDCESPGLATRNRFWALCKSSSQCSELLSHIPGPREVILRINLTKMPGENR